MEDYDSDGDPSFLSAPMPTTEPWKKPIFVVPKNLCNSQWSLVNNDQYKVFLRIKPGAGLNTTQAVLDNNTLLTTVPKESVTYKVLAKSNSLNLQRKFGFTSIFDGTASQSDVFKECVLQPLKAFLQGENCLLMAFGTTSAGKTFTMQGTPDHPGIIPRALTYIFQNLEGNLEDSCLQPYRGTQLVSLSAGNIALAKSFKNQILSLDLSKFHRSYNSSHMSFKSFSHEGESYRSEAFEELQNHINIARDELVLGETTEQFSVWMSMVEIYNDYILDLLQFPNEKDTRPSLSLGEDDRGGFYVKNAQQIQVRNGHEAYQISQFGRLNLHRAATALNDKSSRSHCLITLSLVRRQQDSRHCNRICFVDLAGSERVKKTRNDGQRLVESNSINKSLSVLGKCLQILKMNQSGKANRIVPVRDSKLTKLFKNALLGNEKLTFIINISTDPMLFDETLHVLKFSALAQEIVPKAQPTKRPSRFSQIFHGSLQPSFGLSAFPSVSDLTDKSDDSNRLKEMLEDAERRICELERINDAYRRDIKELEDHCEETEKRAEALGELLLKEQEDLKTIQGNMNNQVLKIMGVKNQEKEDDLTRLRTKLSREKDELENYYKQKMKGLKAQIQKLNDKMKLMVEPSSAYDAAYQLLFDENKKLKSVNKELKEYLDEAVQDYKDVLDENEKLKTALQDQTDEAVDSEYYETQIEELSTMLAAAQEERERLEAAVRSQPQSHEDQQILQNLRAINEEMLIENSHKDETIAKLEKMLEELEDELSLNDEKTASLQKDLDNLAGVWLDSHLVHGLEAEYEKFKVLENKYEEAIFERDDLKKQLMHEKEVKEFLENEAKILKKSVKETCTKEANLLNEIDALKAAIRSLEQEASGKFSEQFAILSKEKSRLEDCYTKSQDEIKRVKDEQTDCVNKLKSVEMTLIATQKKLEIAEYQRKVFETLKDKSEDELKVTSELKETIERLENELINKEHEFMAFENSKKLLIAQHEIELEKYREESARLKKEVQFNRDFMLENLKHSAKKDEVKSLQDQLTTMKFALRENYNERSPLGNRTNLMVPVGNLVEVSPFPKLQTCGKHQPDENRFRLSRIFSSLDNLTAIAQQTPLKEVQRDSNSLPGTIAVKAQSAKKANKHVENHAKSSRRPRSVKKKTVDDSAGNDDEQIKEVTIQASPAKDVGQETISMPVSSVLKSKKKPRTIKERDPSDHPALSKSTRGRRRSVSPPKPANDKAKKKLFSCDDFVEFSDHDSPVATSPENKRALRPRTRKYLTGV